MEVVNRLSTVLNTEVLTKTINVAKELQNSILLGDITSEAKATDIDFKENQIQCVFLSLHDAVKTFQQQTLEQEIISEISPEALEKVTNITSKIDVSLTAVIGNLSNIILEDDQSITKEISEQINNNYKINDTQAEVKDKEVEEEMKLLSGTHKPEAVQFILEPEKSVTRESVVPVILERIKDDRETNFIVSEVQSTEAAVEHMPVLETAAVQDAESEKFVQAVSVEDKKATEEIRSEKLQKISLGTFVFFSTLFFISHCNGYLCWKGEKVMDKTSELGIYI